MLKINGKCAVVLPDGQDLFSKINTTLVAIREYLMKTCDLKEIIYLPSGIFTYTSIKTCVFYFVKKREILGFFSPFDLMILLWVLQMTWSSNRFSIKVSEINFRQRFNHLSWALKE